MVLIMTGHGSGYIYSDIGEWNDGLFYVLESLAANGTASCLEGMSCALNFSMNSKSCKISKYGQQQKVSIDTGVSLSRRHDCTIPHRSCSLSKVPKDLQSAETFQWHLVQCVVIYGLQLLCCQHCRIICALCKDIVNAWGDMLLWRHVVFVGIGL